MLHRKHRDNVQRRKEVYLHAHVNLVRQLIQIWEKYWLKWKLKKNVDHMRLHNQPWQCQVMMWEQYFPLFTSLVYKVFYSIFIVYVMKNYKMSVCQFFATFFLY